LCEEMCPEFEQFAREQQGRNGLSSFEILEGTNFAANRRPLIDRNRAVKAFERSSAGKLFLPQDVRTPATLIKTLKYLMESILSSDAPYASIYGFVRDRSRAVIQGKIILLLLLFLY